MYDKIQIENLKQEVGKGCIFAANQLGYHYGDVDVNLDEAVRYLRLATTLPECPCHLSEKDKLTPICNLASKLMERNKPGDLEESRTLFFQAADGGHPRACYYVGVILERENNAKCIPYYRKSAKQGFQDAIAALKDMGMDSYIGSYPM